MGIWCFAKRFVWGFRLWFALFGFVSGWLFTYEMMLGLVYLGWFVVVITCGCCCVWFGVLYGSGICTLMFVLVGDCVCCLGLG